VAGFLAWAKTDASPGSWQAAPGFLTGAAGVALALLAATSAVEPAWDRALLASCAPVSSPISTPP
jgi:hypothetical protein